MNLTMMQEDTDVLAEIEAAFPYYARYDMGPNGVIYSRADLVSESPARIEIVSIRLDAPQGFALNVRRMGPDLGQQGKKILGLGTFASSLDEWNSAVIIADLMLHPVLLSVKDSVVRRMAEKVKDSIR